MKAFLQRARMLSIVVTIWLLLARATFVPPNAYAAVPLPNDLGDLALQLALQDFHGLDLTGKDGALSKLSFDLIQLYADYQTQLEATGNIAALQSTVPLLPLLQNQGITYVVIDAIASQDVNALRAALEGLGLQSASTFGVVVSGAMPVLALPDLAGLSSLRFARPALFETDQGMSISQGDRAMGSDLVRRQIGISGKGVTVGILSDSYNCLGGAANDVANGEVPPNLLILSEEPRCAQAYDEGRAMVQLVHDIAPGAKQVFHTALGGQAAFANGILALAEAGQADVIVDDVRYLAEPMFQDGIIAQAVDQVVAAGVPYFASAGNNGRHAYTSPFVSILGLLPINLLGLSLLGGILHDFDPGPGVDPLQKVTIPVGATATFILNWDQPYASATGGAGSASDLDMVLLGLGSLSPIALAIDKNTGRDPVEILRYTNPGPGTTFNLAILHLTGPVPSQMKYIYTGDGVTINEYDTQSSTIYGHANARGAQAVGAAHYIHTPAYGTDPPRLQRFSSAGPTPILYDPQGAPILDIRPKPNLVAPDGINTSFFGTDINDPGDGSDTDSFPNFFGTSAAAPHAAAVAALMLELQPALTPAQLYAALESSAIDMGAPGFDDDSGYGLIQALPAMTKVARHDLENLQSTPVTYALPGQPVSYHIVLTNLGPSAAARVTISNTAPAGLVNVRVNGLARSAVMQLDTLAVGEQLFFTVTGEVDPSLAVDTKLVNQSVVASFGDSQVANNSSSASITVRVPRVQFDISEVDHETDGMRHFRIVLDRANPYAEVKVHYTTSSDRVETAYTPRSGVIIIPPGELSAVVALPDLVGDVASGETVSLHLSQPHGSILGTRSTVILATNPDSDHDGVPDDEDDAPQDACIPHKLADACDQEPDGLTNGEEANYGTDPTNPDSDGDGINDGDEVANGSDPNNACDPRADIAACTGSGGGNGNGNNGGNNGGNNNGGNGGDGDGGGKGGNGDGDGKDDDDDTGADGDQDGDGVKDSVDPAPRDPCIPNANHAACLPSGVSDPLTRDLYLPGIRSD